MKMILFILSLLSTVLIMAPSAVLAQNITGESEGKRVNETGGLSPESVDLAVSNGTTQVLNTPDSSNETRGLSPESVTESQY